jgi:hypothetical protein
VNADALILRLQKSHRAVVRSISEIQPYLRRFPEVRPRLMILEEQLLLHWSLQDVGLWEKLQANASLQGAQEKMVDFLIQDLKEMKIKHFSFFEKYGSDAKQGSTYQLTQHFTEFIRAIMARFQMEEEYLLPMLRDLL